MDNYSKFEKAKFRCSIGKELIWIVIFTIVAVFIYSQIRSGNIDVKEPLLDIYDRFGWSINENIIKFFFSICFAWIILWLILICIANKRSYIEIRDTRLILKKPIFYPFTKMETLSIPYEEIESIKINPKNRNIVTITKKCTVSCDKTIKFFW